MTRILVTGSAGFIGFHLVKKLLDNGYEVTGIDNINNYYDVKLKKSRLEEIQNFINKRSLNKKYKFFKIDLANKSSLKKLFNENTFDYVVNLAAQAGVRYSLENPDAYVESNLIGFVNLLECCREKPIKHFLFASSSSVYGMNIKQPFSTSDNTDFPISLYAATKKSNELIAHSYSHLFKIPSTGLRFFTVYGPYGRPDMAYFKFTKLIEDNKKIDIYNNGKMKRDFTYIDDIIEGVFKVMKSPPKTMISNITNAKAPYRLLNIGNNNPVTLDRFISAIENSLSKKAKKNMLPMQDGDVPITFADINDLYKQFGFQPSTTIEDGIDEFVKWYKLFYQHT
jgi:UDP-glucuronate 4-epimerase